MTTEVMRCHAPEHRLDEPRQVIPQHGCVPAEPASVSPGEGILPVLRNPANGQKYNFNDIAPNGITFAQFVSNTPLSGVAGYPLAFALAGTTMAVGELKKGNGGTRQ